MNFLAHLYLGRSDPELLVGNLMGDFVKGRLEQRYAPGVAKGIVMHRRVDSFAGANDIFKASKRRIDPLFGHYRGILVDLFYDHFLASGWKEFTSLPLHAFLNESFIIVKRHEPVLPSRLRALYPLIINELIPSYCEVDGIDRALARMGGRLQRENPLAKGGDELRRNYTLLRDDFRRFIPEVVQYTETLM